MASACVNQILDSSSPSSFGWFSPRISFSRDFPVNQEQPQPQPHSHSLLEDDSCFDFEFRPVGGELKKMHSADELFFDGKLMPLHLSETTTTTTMVSQKEDEDEDQQVKESLESGRGDAKIVINDIFNKNSSPKAPKCAGGWKEFLGLKKSDKSKTTTSTSKSLKFFLNRNSNSKTDSTSSSMNLPLLDSEIEQEPPSISSSSRLSLSSSSSSGPDHEDLPLPRLSLDSEKSTLPKVKLTKQLKTKGKTISTTTTKSSNSKANARVGRSAVRRASSSTSSSRGVSVDSPRMNSSGKIVFHSLERSSSSPSSFNGGPRMKARGMERSYSANVRIRPVLNVPVCSSLRVSKSGSVFGFGQLFYSSSSQKRDGNGCNRNQSMRRNGSGNNR